MCTCAWFSLPRTCMPGPQVSRAPGLSWRTDHGTSWHRLHLWVFHLKSRKVRGITRTSKFRRAPSATFSPSSSRALLQCMCAGICVEGTIYLYPWQTEGASHSLSWFSTSGQSCPPLAGGWIIIRFLYCFFLVFPSKQIHTHKMFWTRVY